jgi:hypothetical protein
MADDICSVPFYFLLFFINKVDKKKESDSNKKKFHFIIIINIFPIAKHYHILHSWLPLTTAKIGG